ncbi:MAG: DUF4293 domain-containing protein [Bacteroidales bacterium]|nr:DUF4293 domain-containing protein [Bacteroidales bacterium]
MIQRIQTIYLALVAALSGILLYGNIVNLVGENGESYSLSYRGISLMHDGAAEIVEKSLPLTILLFALPLLFLISIFLFKNRKLQIRLTVFSTLLQAGALIMILYYVFFTVNKLGASLLFNVKITFPLIGVILGYLAFRAILKDELLIKSYDRIR